MKKIKVLSITVLSIIVLATGIFTGYNIHNWFQPENDTETLQTSIEEKISEIGELASVEDYYTNSAVETNAKSIKGWEVPLTKKRFIVKYSGIIKAGVDVSDIEIKTSNNEIHISIPEAKILSHEIDEKSLEVLDETNNIFNPITITDYNNFQIEQKAIVEKNAINNGLLEKAQNNAKRTIELFVSSVNTTENYEIIFD